MDAMYEKQIKGMKRRKRHRRIRRTILFLLFTWPLFVIIGFLVLNDIVSIEDIFSILQSVGRRLKILLENAGGIRELLGRILNDIANHM